MDFPGAQKTSGPKLPKVSQEQRKRRSPPLWGHLWHPGGVPFLLFGPVGGQKYELKTSSDFQHELAAAEHIINTTNQFQNQTKNNEKSD